MIVTYSSGNPVYSKRCGNVQGFDGIIVSARGRGYEVLNPKNGLTYQRDHYDLIPLPDKEKAAAKSHATHSTL